MLFTGYPVNYIIIDYIPKTENKPCEVATRHYNLVRSDIESACEGHQRTLDLKNR